MSGQVNLMQTTMAEEGLPALLSAVRSSAPNLSWAAYRVGEKLHRIGQSGGSEQWPENIAHEVFEAFCQERALNRWVTGQGESALGWLLASNREAENPILAELARKLGLRLQTEILARVQASQRVLYEITYLASSTHDRLTFLQGVHHQLSKLIDAENFYLALYDSQTDKLTWPYYVDNTDDDILDADAYEIIDRQHMTMTGYVVVSGEPMFLDATDIAAAQEKGLFYCVGARPEFWMGVPLKNASDEVFGMLAMQVYDVSRIYSMEDRELFLVVGRHVAMALDRLLHRVHLEEIVTRRTLELSSLNDTLRSEVADRERAEHLQRALFQITELASQPGEMAELFRGLHGIVGELLFARNFYIALFDEETSEVTFPYYVDEFRDSPPKSRRGERGVTEYVIRQRRPCLMNRQEFERLNSLGEIAVRSDPHQPYSWLGIPLFDDDTVRGVLVVQSYSAEIHYSQRDQELLSFVSRHIDTAFSRRSAAQAIHTANVHLEARVQDRTRELDQVNAKLQHENAHDALTGLPNRAHLQQSLNGAWQTFYAYGQKLAVMFIDLDRFKTVNDSLGHHSGDQLLIQVAERLRRCMRDSDLLARLGGDEFAVLAFGASSDQISAIAERIVDAFDVPFHIDGHTVFSSCSVGVVHADRQFHQEPADLLRDADTAMYRVKNAGRDGYVLFSQEVRREVSDQMEQESALRKALKNDDELRPYFQPIVDVQSGAILALEALIRWCQPGGKIVAPGQFLPALEGLRLIGRLDLHMLQSVVALLADPAHAHWPTVHVNCSSYSITRAEFPGEVISLLTEYGVAPSRICLELTEGALVAEPELARQAMKQLADNGVMVMLDDFGAGFSSLSYVHQYQFSGLKIDKSFVLELSTSPRSRAIVHAIVRMAESLGLSVIAEGVEDVETLNLLREMGAGQAQGYYFSVPVPKDALKLISGD